MRVRCDKIINPVTGEHQLEHPSIQIGEEYVVLEVDASKGREITFRIFANEHNSLGLWDSEMFTVVDAALPSNWIVNVDVSGSMSLAPSRWIRAGFWEEFFDLDQAARAVYEEELAIILAEDRPERTS